MVRKKTTATVPEENKDGQQTTVKKVNESKSPAPVSSKRQAPENRQEYDVKGELGDATARRVSDAIGDTLIGSGQYHTVREFPESEADAHRIKKNVEKFPLGGSFNSLEIDKDFYGEDDIIRRQSEFHDEPMGVTTAMKAEEESAQKESEATGASAQASANATAPATTTATETTTTTRPSATMVSTKNFEQILQDAQNPDANIEELVGIGDAYISSEKENTEETIKAQEANLASLNEKLDESEVARTKAETDYATYMKGILNDLQAERDKLKQQDIEQTRRDKNLAIFGGLGEVAAHIANLIGTTHGAAPMKWESPQKEWQKRADELRREREAKSENYRQQYQNLQNQMATIAMQMGTARADRADSRARSYYDANGNMITYKANADSRVNGIKYQNDSAVVKAKMDDKTTRANRALQAAQAIASIQAGNANRRMQDIQSQRTMELYGYDPRTGKWGESHRGYYPGKGSTYTTQQMSAARDNLARQMEFENYGEFELASSAANSPNYRTWKKNGHEGFTKEQYIEYTEKYNKAQMGANSQNIKLLEDDLYDLTDLKSTSIASLQLDENFKRAMNGDAEYNKYE